MKKISIADATLVGLAETLSFKEKIETARLLDRLQPDVIELPMIKNATADTLFIRTVCAFVKNSAVSVPAELSEESVKAAAAAVASAKHAVLRIEVPVSPVGMEYKSHMKPQNVLNAAETVFKTAAELCTDCELYAADATRADIEFLKQIIDIAIENGIKKITLCDDEGKLLPDEFSEYISSVKAVIPVLENCRLGFVCRSSTQLSVSNALTAIKGGACEIVVSCNDSDLPKAEVLADIINSSGDRFGVSCDINYNELHRITKQIEWITGAQNSTKSVVKSEARDDSTPLGATDTLMTVKNAIIGLGYDLSDDDSKKVYDEFKRVACNKSVGSRELEAIIAGVALQVPPTYKLVSYVVNNGNILPASSQIKLLKNGKEVFGIATGDGPVDASFTTLEQIIGTHFELDDFQIQAVTEGRDSLGSALVKLRHGGKLYSGNGISTDIIGSSIRAYINAVNKIVYEEALK